MQGMIPELSTIVRFGADGTVPLSFVHGLEPFVRDNIRWVRGKDSPAIGKGIHGVWNDVNKEVIWTVSGISDGTSMKIPSDKQYFSADFKRSSAEKNMSTFPFTSYEETDYDNRYRDWETDRKSTRLNSRHRSLSRMPSSA